jgi:hypothetical protein
MVRETESAMAKQPDDEFLKKNYQYFQEWQHGATKG